MEKKEHYELSKSDIVKAYIRNINWYHKIGFSSNDLIRVLRSISIREIYRPMYESKNIEALRTKYTKYMSDTLLNLIGINEMNKEEALQTMLGAYTDLEFQTRKSGISNLKIYGMNPDRKYSSIYYKSDDNSETIKWELITDGNPYQKLEVPEYPSLFPHPKLSDFYFTSKMWPVRTTLTKDSTFSILQGSLNGQITAAHIYTESQDRYELQELLNYSGKKPEEIEGVHKHSDRCPYTYVLKK